MKEQLSLFDIDLPPQKQIQQTYEKINFAQIPKEEPKIKWGPILTVSEILKLLYTGSYKVSCQEVLADIFKCGAIAISNKFDKPQAKEREEIYLSTIKKYDKDMQELIRAVFEKIYVLLQSQIDYSFSDWVGELYMQAEASNSRSGQFFTPYSVSKMCAETAISERKINEYI